MIVILGLLLPLAAVADIYKWVDEDGNVVYSDEPREGAERLERSTPESSYRFETPQRRSSADRSGDDADEDDSRYEEIRIVQPEDEGTVRDNQGLVDVRLELSPSLRAEHRVQFLFNGEPRGDPSRSLETRLTEVHRGEHQVAARVLGEGGEVIAESDPVTFYMHQASRLLPGGQGSGANP
ncbi:DUF4124 domain-containing protein [Aquisalimonas asiatica]|uniref:DUF4124 domain-containing protein n=1 Tax=Aquisalimonas asiatica TaxID=406100 RepID=UPI00149547BE|nr:DUF4124 domain-containing protein [Aquisalimonas asiatica]